MNDMTIAVPPRFLAVQAVRDVLMQIAVHHRDRAIRAAAEAARQDIFDVDVAQDEAVVAQLDDHPYGRRLSENLAELMESENGDR